MDEFENKYGLEEDEKVKSFHRNRRMFAIYDGKLFVADKNLPYSHAVWFEKEGWISRTKDDLMDSITRGIVDASGNVYFYIGYDFRINEDIEDVFFSHLEELVKKANLQSNVEIFGGLIKQEAGKIWPPIKKYGKVKDNL